MAGSPREQGSPLAAPAAEAGVPNPDEDPALVARVARDAAITLEREWSAVEAQCPADEGLGPSDPADFEISVTFDPEGREIARSLGSFERERAPASEGPGGAASARASCLLSMQQLRLAVPPPGRTVTVFVRLPRR